MDPTLISVALRERRKEVEKERTRDLSTRDQDLDGSAVLSGAASNGRNGSKEDQSSMPASLQPKQQQQQPEAAGGSSDPNVDGIAASGPKKRKKISRACSNCQTAHLTCSTSRPCARCVKRGLQDSCQDGARKKAKYLLDVEDERESFLEVVEMNSARAVWRGVLRTQ